MLKKGDAVRYYDPVGRPHMALLTNIFAKDGVIVTAEDAKCAVNIAYVTEDSSQTDPYGQQIVRKTSVAGKSQYTTYGNYWEPLKPIE